MKRSLLGLMILPALACPCAADDIEKGKFVLACIQEAARLYDLPSSILVILLDVENGRLGEVSQNKNHTVDIGPMQVNGTWLPKLADHWGTSQEAAFRALRDEICPNIEGGAWILRQALDEAKGDFWDGVARYHSHSGPLKAAYLRSIYEHTVRIEAKAAASMRDSGGAE